MDRQNTVVENLGVKATQGLSRQRQKQGIFSSDGRSLATTWASKDRVPILEDQRMDLKEQGEGVEKGNSPTLLAGM